MKDTDKLVEASSTALDIELRKTEPIIAPTLSVEQTYCARVIDGYTREEIMSEMGFSIKAVRELESKFRGHILSRLIQERDFILAENLVKVKQNIKRAETAPDEHKKGTRCRDLYAWLELSNKILANFAPSHTQPPPKTIIVFTDKAGKQIDIDGSKVSIKETETEIADKTQEIIDIDAVEIK